MAAIRYKNIVRGDMIPSLGVTSVFVRRTMAAILTVIDILRPCKADDPNAIYASNGTLDMIHLDAI